MPFKSEKQRRYLWANEPKIAREWTDRYGAANGGIMQADALNYNPSNMVSVPTEFRARAHSPNTHLAYITDDEAGILQALKPDTPHKGPMNIPNYDSFDAAGGYSNPGGAGDKGGYSASSGGGGGGWQASHRADAKKNEMAEQVRRNYVEKQKIKSSPLHSRYSSNWKTGGAKNNFMGGIGNLLRFINPLNLLGGFIDNPVLRGIFSGVVNNAGKFKKGMNEFSQYDNFADYLNRNKQGVETIDIRDKFNRNNNEETMTADLNLDFITPETISSELDYNTPITERWANQTGLNLNEAGLNKAQTDYLDKIGKTNKAVGNTGYFTYNTPEKMKRNIQDLNKKSEGFFGGFDSDKITFGDKNTYATDKDVNKYMMENYNLRPENEGIKNVLGLDI
jgi:hypothetical protein